MKKMAFLKTLFLLIVVSGAVHGQSTSEYTFVTYNVENLFDADEFAIYDDYKPSDKQGNVQYTNIHILNKVKNAVHLLKQYNDGKGPDIIAMVEMESDYTPTKGKPRWSNESEFLAQYANTTLEKMLGEEFDKIIADLPSELLLLKGMIDGGMWDYEIAVGSSPKNDKGLPTTVQKNVIYSRLPIVKEKTIAHPLQQARSILETWIKVNGAELAVFTNHWKSGAGSDKMEVIRLQNAKVLRDRLDELLAENPNVDFVLAGDFNSDYNQKARYDFPTTAVNDVLKSVGDEQSVANAETNAAYNLWYEYPIEKRGSDTYRGYWGTLMQIMISPGMYDGEGVSYVDNSFERGDFGFNTYSTSGEPRRWSSTFSGSGYSDHLPVSMKFKLSTGKEVELVNPSKNDDDQWEAIPINYTIPIDFYSATEFTSADPTVNPDFFDEYFYLTATVTSNYKFVVNGTTYDVYTPSFRLNSVLKEIAGTDKEINFYGRFSQFRGNWQFVVEAPNFITIKE